MPRIGAAAFATQLAYRLAYAPELRIVGVCFEAAFVGERQHLVVDTRRVANAQHVHTTVDKFLRYPVDSHIALRTYQHLTLSA